MEPAGSSVHGISQVRILEWVAISSLQGIFPNQGSNPHLLCLLSCRWFFTHWAIREGCIPSLLLSYLPNEQHGPGIKMVSTCSFPKKGFFMEQDTCVFELSLTMRDASIWNKPSSSCISSSETDGIFSPFASSHCTSGWGNHPLPVHFNLIPPSSGPTNKTRGSEPRPGEESHLSESWRVFSRSSSYFTATPVEKDGQSAIVLRGRKGVLFFSHEINGYLKFKR